MNNFNGAYLSKIIRDATVHDLTDMPHSDPRHPVNDPQLAHLPGHGPSTIEDTLAERGSRYGDFVEQGSMTQALKNTVRGMGNWGNLDLYQKEAVDMILVKVSRIVCGDPGYGDNWHDILGYAKLVEDQLARDNKD